MLRYFILLLILLSGSKLISQSNPQIEDGIYLVLGSYTDSTQAAEDSSIIPYSHLFLEGNTDGQPLFFKISLEDYVPLKLRAKPDTQPHKDDRKKLMLQLNRASAKKMKRFTKKNLNKPVAIVIGGQAMTMHKIRNVIDSGRLQITRCTDRACEKLFFELQDNVESD